MLQRSTSISSKNSRSTATTADGGKKGESSFFSGLFRRKDEKERGKKKPSELTADDIGEPEDFRHLSHMGFNPLTGTFDTENIPDEWVAVFKKAGISKKQLKNKETAGFIATFVNEQGAAGGARRKKGPPPPPPAKSLAFKSSAPPPPPKKGANINDVVVASGTDVKSAVANTTVPPPRPPPPPASTGEVETEQKGTIDLPPIDAGRAQLLASIRGANLGVLKHVDSTPTPPSGSQSPTGAASGNSGDLMASMLAKALAERNRKIRHSDSEDDRDDW